MKSGLPGSLIRKFGGNMKKAWAEFRKEKHGKNPRKKSGSKKKKAHKKKRYRAEKKYLAIELEKRPRKRKKSSAPRKAEKASHSKKKKSGQNFWNQFL